MCDLTTLTLCFKLKVFLTLITCDCNSHLCNCNWVTVIDISNYKFLADRQKEHCFIIWFYTLIDCHINRDFVLLGLKEPAGGNPSHCHQLSCNQDLLSSLISWNQYPLPFSLPLATEWPPEIHQGNQTPQVVGGGLPPPRTPPRFGSQAAALQALPILFPVTPPLKWQQW